MWIAVASSVVFLVTLILVWQYVELDVNMERLDNYFYALLYRGKSDGSLENNGTINVSIMSNFNRAVVIGLIKYKEDGEVGVFFAFSIPNDSENHYKTFLEKINEEKIEYFARKGPLKRNIKRALLVDVKQNLDLLKKVIDLFCKEVLGISNIRFNVNTSRLSLSKDILIDFENTLGLEKKGVRIDVPLTNWEALKYIIKGKKWK